MCCLGHAGFDKTKGTFDTRNLPVELQRLFDQVEMALKKMGASGVTAQEATEILKMAAQDPSIVKRATMVFGAPPVLDDGSGTSSSSSTTAAAPVAPPPMPGSKKTSKKDEDEAKKAAAAAKTDLEPVVAAAVAPPVRINEEKEKNAFLF